MKHKLLISLYLMPCAWSQLPVERPETAPIYRVSVVSRTLEAVSYEHQAGPSPIGFEGTVLLPKAKGEAIVDNKGGRVSIAAKFEGLTAPTMFGREYLTYVLWAITPEGRAKNLGEIVADPSNKGRLNVTTDLQAFGLLVTAEPYFSVTQPSDVVVLENVVLPETTGKRETVAAKFDLLPRGQYTFYTQPGRIQSPDLEGQKVSYPRYEALLALYQAQNAVQIARSVGADRTAAGTFDKASSLLRQAQEASGRNMDPHYVVTTAREAAQMAEDARTIAVRVRDEERLAQVQSRLDQERAGRERAEAEARRAQADAQSQVAAARADAERAEAEAREAQQQAARQAQTQSLAMRQRPAPPSDADRMREPMDTSKRQFRAQLLSQMNSVLPALDTPRGLVVTLPDTMFDPRTNTLRPEAVARLARVSAFIATNAGLRVTVEGHVDASDGDHGRVVAQARAESVREDLIEGRVPGSAVRSYSIGSSRPLTSSATAAGREQNRRVELVVSGDAIGSFASWDRPYALGSSGNR